MCKLFNRLAMIAVVSFILVLSVVFTACTGSGDGGGGNSGDIPAQKFAPQFTGLSITDGSGNSGIQMTSFSAVAAAAKEEETLYGYFDKTTLKFVTAGTLILDDYLGYWHFVTDKIDPDELDEDDMFYGNGNKYGLYRNFWLGHRL